MKEKIVGTMNAGKTLYENLMAEKAVFRKKIAKKAWVYRKNLRDEFFEAIKDVSEHPITQEMKNYPHHCTTDCYQHCLNVAYYNYYICKLLKKDYMAAARAGMIHDLFLYDWHTHTKETGDHFHGLTHPKAALEVAEKYFVLTDKEREIILKHMWPVTPFAVPKSFEAFLITLTDKYCGTCEILDFAYTRWILGRKASRS